MTADATALEGAGCEQERSGGDAQGCWGHRPIGSADPDQLGESGTRDL